MRHLNCTCNWAVALTGKNLGNLDTNILYKPCMGFGIHMNLKKNPKNQTKKKNHSEYTWIIVFISFSLWDSLGILNYKSCTYPAWDSVWRKHMCYSLRDRAQNAETMKKYCQMLRDENKVLYEDISNLRDKVTFDSNFVLLLFIWAVFASFNYLWLMGCLVG